MEFPRSKETGYDRDDLSPFALLGLVLKIVTGVVLLAVGLKLTFWAVDVVDQVLHRPAEVAILQPLLNPPDGGERSFSIERDGDAVTVRDHNVGSMFMLVGLLLVLFGAIGRAIAALIGGAVRLLASIDFKRRPEKTPTE